MNEINLQDKIPVQLNINELNTNKVNSRELYIDGVEIHDILDDKVESIKINNVTAVIEDKVAKVTLDNLIADENNEVYEKILNNDWNRSNVNLNYINCLIYGNNTFIAGSSGKGIHYSSDGITWNQSNITSDSFENLTYGNNTFIAGSLYNGLYYSSDGITWNHSNITSGRIGSLTYGNNIFIAGSDLNDGLYYSFDGITWTQSNITSSKFYCLTYGNNTFIAGSDGEGLYYSTDGITWIQSNIDSGDFTSLTYGNNTFIAGSDNGLYYSLDGITWTQSNITSSKFYCLIYGNNTFIAGSYDYRGLYYSSDGITWTHSNITSGRFYCLTYGNNTFIAGSEIGLYYLVTSKSLPLATKDYVNEKLNNLDNVVNLTDDQSIAGTKSFDKIVAKNAAIENLLTSVDAVELNTIDSNIVEGNFRDGCYSPELDISVFPSLKVDSIEGSGLYYTKNGKEFYQCVSTDSGINVGSWETPIWDGTKFIATGSNGIWHSSDGINWIKDISGEFDEIYHYFDGVNHWYNIGNFVTKNPDISTWNFTNRKVSGINHGAYINGKFIVYSNNSTLGGAGIYSTEDGVTYTKCIFDGVEINGSNWDGFESGYCNYKDESGSIVKKFILIASAIKIRYGVLYTENGITFNQLRGTFTGLGYESAAFTKDGYVVIGSMDDDINGFLVYRYVNKDPIDITLDGVPFTLGWWNQPVYIEKLGKYYSVRYKNKSGSAIVSDDCITWRSTNRSGRYYPPTNCGNYLVLPSINHGLSYVNYVNGVVTKGYVDSTRNDISNEGKSLVNLLSQLDDSSSLFKVKSTLNCITKVLKNIYLKEDISLINEFSESEITLASNLNNDIDGSISFGDFLEVLSYSTNIFKSMVYRGFNFRSEDLSILMNLNDLSEDSSIEDFANDINSIIKVLNNIKNHSSDYPAFNIIWSSIVELHIEDADYPTIINKLSEVNGYLKEGIR